MKYKEKKILLWVGIAIIVNCSLLLKFKWSIDTLEKRITEAEIRLSNIEDLIYDDAEEECEIESAVHPEQNNL